MLCVRLLPSSIYSGGRTVHTGRWKESGRGIQRRRRAGYVVDPHILVPSGGKNGAAAQTEAIGDLKPRKAADGQAGRVRVNRGGALQRRTHGSGKSRSRGLLARMYRTATHGPDSCVELLEESAADYGRYSDARVRNVAVGSTHLRDGGAQDRGPATSNDLHKRTPQNGGLSQNAA